MKDYCLNIFKLKTSQQFILLLMFFLIQSCEEDLTKINAQKKTNFASQVIYNGNIIQRDSGLVKVNFRAPLIEKQKRASILSSLIKNRKPRARYGQSMRSTMRKGIFILPKAV
jgi:hypothetical protein